MTIRSLIACVDFSGSSLAAARWAALHLAPEAQVLLAHVAPVPDLPLYARPQLEAEVARSPRIRHGLRGLATSIGEERVQLRTLVGQPETVIPALAAEVGVDAIVVGRPSRRRGGARFGGTVAARILARARHPVLIVHAPTFAAPRHVLAAIDHRPAGGDVLEAAGALGMQLDARVDALHAIDPAVAELARSATSAPVGARDEHADRWLDARARAWLESLVGVRCGDTSAIVPVLAHGEPGEAILRHAGRTRPDLIVIGADGGGAHRSPDTRVNRIGSTARLVTWAAPCPVLVLPSAVRGAGNHASARHATIATNATGRVGFALSPLRPHDGISLPPAIARRLGVPPVGRDGIP